MKIRRYKKVNKNLNYYTNNFGFRKPYQLLADGTFCFAALNNKINIADDVPKYLQSEIKLVTTQCAILEMESLGQKLAGALLILKNYIVHKCGHEGKPLPGSRCILSMVCKDNPSHYIVCTQDRDLQEKLRNLAGVPLLYLHSKTPVLEPPSPATVKRAEEKISGLVQSEVEKINKLKMEEGIKIEEQKFKKRKKKGANPLSCKKKQKKTQNSPIQKKESRPEMEKKKRKKVRIPQHVKEEILKRTFNKINEGANI
ncbi:unnamed protein product [Ceutorhynchus assimilis]|uniref:rRNA-processing protein UTP23 homolog n=1 Tax=Ceutorhynchus assimilis TaxID=467358 RepID=A0A9N9MT10_9CUCU|nr:unnamed protein product [Ceutorhynchus assimilis]